jgi:hypothetical protein
MSYGTNLSDTFRQVGIRYADCWFVFVFVVAVKVRRL